MTADDALAGRLDPFAVRADFAVPADFTVPADDDTEGCLCLVAGYAKTEGLISTVTAGAGKRVMMSPALGDFLQLRYVDIGPPPTPDSDRSGPARLIADELMAVREIAGRSHFALIVIAKSAMVIENLIADCVAQPFLAGLRMRFVGIASSDDRAQGQRLAEITSAPASSWRNERELVDAVRQRCEELPRYFAARGEPGLTRAQLTALRDGCAQPAAAGDSADGDPDGDSDGDPDGDTGAVPDEASAPDVLDGASERTTADQETATGQDADVAAAGSATAAGATAEPVARRLAGVGLPRWRPGVPWRKEGQSPATADPGPVSPPTAMGLVYLLVVADQDAADDPALGRLQAALLGVDKCLAAQPSRGYQVRLIHGRDEDLRGEMHEAGRLTRKAVRRSVKTGDFTTVVKGLRGSLRRDRVLVESIATAAGLALIRPAVAIFTADPPVADLGAAAVFGELAAEAVTAWVVPRKLEDLVSPGFSTQHGVAVLGEHQAVADEVVDLMTGVPAS